jgi:hypothetical protein
MVPESFAALLAAFTPCCTAPTFQTFRSPVAGWLHCPGRHTVTGVAVAAGEGVVGWRHISAFHRFFSRARWDLDAVGQVVFTLALRVLPDDVPLLVLAAGAGGRQSGAQAGEGDRAGLDAP